MRGPFRRLCGLLRDRHGTMLVEFGFAAPILCILSLGAMDMGRAMWMDTTLGYAAQEGARYASIHGSESSDPVTDAEVVAYVKQRATGFGDDALSVKVSWAPNRDTGSAVNVAVTRRFRFLLLGFLPIGPIDLSGSATRTVL